MSISNTGINVTLNGKRLTPFVFDEHKKYSLEEPKQNQVYVFLCERILKSGYKFKLQSLIPSLKDIV